MTPALSKYLSSGQFLSTFKCYAGSIWPRAAYITFRNYSKEEKSIYEQDEEGKKPRMAYGKPYPDWRTPWIERDGEWKTKLAIFNRKNPSPEIMNALQNLPKMDFKQVIDWWKSMKDVQELQNQKFLPERVITLGSNLAAVHFFTYRNCAVRLKGSKDWIVGSILDLHLPNTFTEGYHVEAVDCSNFHHNGIRYEGIENLNGLKFLKWLSLKNQKHIDVWCLDRIAGQNGETLEYLDISGCKLDIGCIFALARMYALKMLVITDPGIDNIELQAGISFLENERPELVIKLEAISQPEADNKIAPTR
ncbi:distal membrane-arm assembly complex protein 2 [Pectinophora gossypiella]|uniref:distal membrane-arm assembly complex protein 2 n=1 Tax=Pectinophora gossypiella TaxID=13191 RepID=UPI00214E41A2|nr:distal membrane-arm assembly complex protein 2 [Pectinophora gossypiella]